MAANVKLSCSLKWLFGILSESSSFQHLEARNAEKANFRSILLEPYDHHQCFKKELVNLLTDADLYVSTYHAIFPGEEVVNKSFETLIHNVAKRGGYVLEDGDVVVNGSMLAQKQPFREKSHLALLDVLMVQYAANIVTVQRIVRAARRISTFNASKELPNKTEVDVLLVIWLRKVSEAANEEHYYPCQRRKKRTKSVGIPCIAEDLCSGIRDGQNLVSLLLYYVPQSYTWSGFDLGSDSLSEKQALNNIQGVCDFCTAHFSPSAFHIAPIDFLQWAQSGLLKSNILALLARLFYLFEVERDKFTLKSYGKSSASNFPSGTEQFSVLQSASAGAIMNRGTLSDENKQRSLPQLNHSQSTEIALVLPKLNVSELSSTSTNNRGKMDGGAKLSSRSAKPHMDSTTFDALRSSLGTQQVYPLMAIKRDGISQAKDTHLQPFPLLNRNRPPIPSTTNQLSQNSQKPISFSIDNLKLEEQMKATQRMGSFVRNQKLEHSIVIAGSTAKGPSTRSMCECATKQSLEKCDSNKSESVSLPCEDGSLKISQSIEEKKLTDSQLSTSVSFTIDKQHTYATASAAGLPIVESRVKSRTRAHYLDNKSAPRWYENITPPTSSADKGDKMNQNPSTELRSADSSTNVINLTKLLERQLHHDSAKWKYSTDARREENIPPNVRELRTKLISVIDGLQSENLHLESEVKQQMLQLHGKENKTSEKSLMVGNIPASAAFSFSRTAFNGGDSATSSDKDDPLAAASLPGINHPLKNEHQTDVGFQKVTASLEQFEKDEELLVQQASPCAVGIEKAAECIHQQGTLCAAGTKKDEELNLHQDFPYTKIDEERILQQAFPCAIGTKESGGKTMSYVNADTNHKPIVLSSSNSTNSIETHVKDQTSAVWPLTLTRNMSSEASHLKPSIQYSLSQSSMKKSDAGHSNNSDGDCAHLEGDTASTNPTNPWVPPLHSSLHTEDLRKKGKKIRQRLEERDRARKLASERWKIGKWVDGRLDNQTERDGSYYAAQPYGDEQCQGVGGGQPMLFTSHMYSGPDCYIKPKSKSNLKIIRNAICSVCLAGEVNNTLKLKTLAKLEKTSASHALILFRDTIGFKFRGIYSYYSGERHIMRICGSGPNKINEVMLTALYKYNSGQKDFKEIPSKTLSYSVDGLTIKSKFWHLAKHKLL